MSLDVIDFLNHEVGLFGLDQIYVRSIVFLIVAAAAFAWPRRLRALWWTWTPVDRLRESTVFASIAVYGALVLAAAQREDPLRIVTWLIVFLFVAMNAAAWAWKAGRDH